LAIQKQASEQISGVKTLWEYGKSARQSAAKKIFVIATTPVIFEN